MKTLIIIALALFLGSCANNQPRYKYKYHKANKKSVNKQQPLERDGKSAKYKKLKK